MNSGQSQNSGNCPPQAMVANSDATSSSSWFPDSGASFHVTNNSFLASTNDFLYYITFVDVFSRFTWIYLLKSKAETFTVFKKFKAMTELQFNTKIKNLQTYWEGEFCPLAPFLADCGGINHRLICPHTHHQRKNT